MIYYIISNMASAWMTGDLNRDLKIVGSLHF